MKTDRMKIEILADGTIRIDSDGISLPNHQAAEAFVRDAATLAGGTTEIKHKHGAKGHVHQHGQQTHTH